MKETRYENKEIANGLRAFFATSIAALLAELKPHCVTMTQLSTEIKQFDSLTREQQIVAVCEVGRLLLKNDGPLFRLSAYRQATLLALFDCINRNVFQEILENNTAFRTLILAAHKDIYGPVDHRITRDCTDFEQWKAFVISIRNKITDMNGWELSDKINDFPRICGRIAIRYSMFPRTITSISPTILRILVS